MGKALYPVLIINLLLAIAAAIFGVTLYNQRQVVKAQTLLLQDSVREMTGNLKYETAGELASALQVSVPEDLANMKAKLGDFAKHSKATQMDLETTRERLEVTRNTLEETKATLAATEKDLSDTKQTLADTEKILSDTQQELSETQQSLAKAEDQVDSLKSEAQRLNAQIQERDETIEILEIDKERVIAERDALASQINNLRNSANSGPGSDAENSWTGREALVLNVSRDWNYVVIDKGMVDDLVLNLEPLIHRDNQYIGKLRVTRIEDRVAICDILQETLVDGASVEANDSIFF